MPQNSASDIPNTAGSDEIKMKDPYVADMWEMVPVLSQRRRGTLEFVAKPCRRRYSSPTLVQSRPARQNGKKVESIVDTLCAEELVDFVYAKALTYEEFKPGSVSTIIVSEINLAKDSIVG